MSWTNAYIGLPQCDLGRDRSGVDCWGLVHLVLNDHGLPVPAYAEGYSSTREREEIAELLGAAQASPSWQRIERPEPFDVVLFKRGRLDGHVGVVVDARRMLHVDSRAPSRIERFDIAPWSDRSPSFWRWVETGKTDVTINLAEGLHIGAIATSSVDGVTHMSVVLERDEP